MLVVQGMESRLAASTDRGGDRHRGTFTAAGTVLTRSSAEGMGAGPVPEPQPPIAETYFGVFDLSREYGMYVVAGSVVLPPYHHGRSGRVNAAQ